MAKTTFITSHRMRVKKANETIKNLPERISVFDREAYVEFFLLEDIVRLYDYRLTSVLKKLKREQDNLQKIAILKNLRQLFGFSSRLSKLLGGKLRPAIIKLFGKRSERVH